MPDAIAFHIEEFNTGVIAIPQPDTFAFQIFGLGAGTARVGVIKPQPDGGVTTVFYEDVPQQADSTATVEIGPASTAYSLEIDINGDGIADETRSPSSIEDFNAPSVSLLAFVTTTLPDAIVGTPYSTILEATGGIFPYLYSSVQDTLPPGLGLLGTGIILGTPIEATSVRLTAKVEDLLGSSTNRELGIKVAIGIIIDIKPGSDPNPINLKSEGVIPVAILTTHIADGDSIDFNAADVDQASLTLEGAAAREKGKSGQIGSFEDVDGDGDLDLVVQFPTADLQLTPDDTEAVLDGRTIDGMPIKGKDSIIVVP